MQSSTAAARKTRAPKVAHAEPIAPCSGTQSQFSAKLTPFASHIANVEMTGFLIFSNNAQVFRGFFNGRYIFDSVAGFLRYASPAAAGGFGPRTVACSPKPPESFTAR